MVNKSTVPVGSTRVVERVLDRPDVTVVSNPEFLREGSAVQDFLHPDRIVVGSDDQAAAITVASLYVGIAAPVIVTDPASAETIKYAANAFLATKLSFVNAVAAICEGVGADVNDVVLGLGYDKRIGHEFLRPGPVGAEAVSRRTPGRCSRSPTTPATSSTSWTGVIAVNDEQFDRVTEKVRSAVGGDLAGKTIGVWGLTFKARTDDLRESPSLAIIERLARRRGHRQGARSHGERARSPACPTGSSSAPIRTRRARGPTCSSSSPSGTTTAGSTPAKVAAAMNRRAVVDARNLLDRSEWRRAGFDVPGHRALISRC